MNSAGFVKNAALIKNANLMKNPITVALTLILFSSLIPTAFAQNVTGIDLQPVPNAVNIRWQAPAGITVDHYKIYYAKQSILENNGRYDGSEETIGNQTSLALMDLANRGFMSGDKIYVTVTAVDESGYENLSFGEEGRATVQIAGHMAASFVLEHAIADNQATIRLLFSSPVAEPEGLPSDHFEITDEDGNSVEVMHVTASDRVLVLHTTPMAVRKLHTVTVLATIKSQEDEAVDQSKNSAIFAARPSQEDTAPPPVIAPPPTQPQPEPAISPLPEPTPISEPIEDVTPPEDASNLTLEKELQSDGRYKVHARWRGSANTAGDLSAYHLYESSNEGDSFVGPTALLGTIISTTIANIPPGTFTLKVAAVDETGNESTGIMETIILPETGAATVLLSLGGAALFALQRNRRRLRARK